MKDELKIPNELKEGLRSSLEINAPSSILQNVLSRVKAKQTVAYAPDIQMPFVLTLAFIALGGYYFYSSSTKVGQNTSDFSFQYDGLITSNVFWFSLMAVSAVVLIDLVSQKRRGNRL